MALCSRSYAIGVPTDHHIVLCASFKFLCDGFNGYISGARHQHTHHITLTTTPTAATAAKRDTGGDDMVYGGRLARTGWTLDFLQRMFQCVNGFVLRLIDTYTPLQFFGPWGVSSSSLELPVPVPVLLIFF